MTNDSADQYFGVLLEDLNDKMDILIEGQSIQATIFDINRRITGLEGEVFN